MIKRLAYWRIANTIGALKGSHHYKRLWHQREMTDKIKLETMLSIPPEEGKGQSRNRWRGVGRIWN